LTALPFIERAHAIAKEPQASRRALLTDSLVLELSDRTRGFRTADAKAKELRAVHAELQTLDTPEALILASHISLALQSKNYKGADDLLQHARGLLDREMARLSATARRRAILEGLAELGYEVRESMVTAWAHDGRLVLRKPNTTDYGIELASPSDAARLQVRLVASDRPAVPRNADRDRDMETIWCSEFAKLGDHLASRGGEIVIERAVEVGVEPVKTVVFPDAGYEAREAKQPITRTERF
jgi:hypothetical protein